MANPFVTLDSDTAESAENETIENLPPLKEWAWDFQNDRFRVNSSGQHIEVTENEALKVWIYKALKTERYRYECYKHGIYDTDSPYGVELDEYIGRYPNNEATAQLIIEDIRSCLELNPYIKRIISIKITGRKKDDLTLSIELESVYGEMTANLTA